MTTPIQLLCASLQAGSLYAHHLHMTATDKMQNVSVFSVDNDHAEEGYSPDTGNRNHSTFVICLTGSHICSYYRYETDLGGLEGRTFQDCCSK